MQPDLRPGYLLVSFVFTRLSVTVCFSLCTFRLPKESSDLISKENQVLSDQLGFMEILMGHSSHEKYV